MKDVRIPIAILLIGIGLLLQGGNVVIPDWLDPLNWTVHGPATVAIIEETAIRSTLPASQVALMDSVTFPQEIQKSGGSYLGCFDKDIVDRDKKPPQDLVSYLEAAKKVKLPALVYKRRLSVTAIPLPVDEKTALGKLK
jgi:hypothetical protein